MHFAHAEFFMHLLGSKTVTTKNITDGRARNKQKKTKNIP